MSGNEARNLDRAFPGNPNGGLTQKVAYAVTEMVKKENAGLVIDMHEARLMNPIVNCIITPERALTLSSLAQMELEFSTKEPWHLEPSPTKMFGMTHRGLTDATNALAVLMETGNPAMDYPRGPTNEKLIVEGKDEFYSIAASKGLLYVPYPEKGLPLQHRVARQLAGADALIRVFSEIAEDGQTILVQGIPSYEDIETLGIGHFVLEP
jgi:Succinylglutamate desuccinylase / Aspartoacylase family.